MRSLWETVLWPKTPIKSVISHPLTLTSSGASSLTSLNMSLTSLLSSFSVMCPSPFTSNTRKIRVNASSAVPSDMMWKTNWKVFMKTKLIKDSARLPWTRQSQCSRSRSRRNIWKCASACALHPVLAGPAWRTIRIQMFAKIFTFSSIFLNSLLWILPSGCCSKNVENSSLTSCSDIPLGREIRFIWSD